METTPHWTKHWPEILAQLAPRPQLLVACDFDGTLAPIVSHPDDAALPEETRVLLRRFALCSSVTLAIVSGRLLSDVRARVGIPHAIYCGNHGLEIDGPGISWTHADATARRPELASAVASLREKTAGMDGVLVEDKGLTATVHWRQAGMDARDILREIVTEVVHAHSGLRLAHGKAIWELRPRVDWDKGAAIRHLLARAGLGGEDAIFLGDDETDESAFRSLPRGITLRVGPEVFTAATCRAHDPADAVGFLFCLFGSRLRMKASPASASTA